MLKREDIHIIAEAGTNNNGNLQKAKNLVRIAKNAKADSVKFQMINTWGLYLPGNYEYGHYDINEVIKIRLEGQMTDKEYNELNNYCKEINIQFSSSVFDTKALALLSSYSPPYIKISSSDLNNISFLRKVAEKGIKIVLSTGMSSLKEIEKSLTELYKVNFTDIVLLHCVSVYPAFLHQTNLPFIQTLQKEFGCPVGFSDHTGNSIAACLSLQFGATWLEKHFTEDKKQNGLDHAYAMEEKELTEYIKDIEMAISAINGNDIKISEAEFFTKKRARRSLYASKDLKAGHKITEEDILVVRPESEMSADDYDYILNSVLLDSLNQYQPFSKSIIKK
jgi:sialic acid synthase SpsE